MIKSANTNISREKHYIAIVGKSECRHKKQALRTITHNLVGMITLTDFPAHMGYWENLKRQEVMQCGA